MNKQIKINNIIFTQIENRYHFLNDMRYASKSYYNKLIVDGFLPMYIAKSIASNNTVEPRAIIQEGYAISDRTAKEFGVRQLHISELVTMIGYTKTDIGKLLQAVKRKELNLVLIGLGGTGSNFLYFLNKMAEWTGKIEIFKTLRGYDPDVLDVSNLPRIPFVPTKRDIDNEEVDVPLKAKALPIEYGIISSGYKLYTSKLLPQQLEVARMQAHSTVVYGAPDMATREAFTNSKYTFIAATHSDNRFSLIENPEIDQDLIIETYGKINLGIFFINHLMMTIKFLEHLRDREEPLGAYHRTSENDEPSKRMNFEIARRDMDEETQGLRSIQYKAGSKTLHLPKDNYASAITTVQLPEGA